MAPPSTPNSFPSSEMFDDLIIIEVGTGDTKRTFEVFKGVLCFYSAYFSSALNGRFRESTEGVIKLPTEDPLIFDLFHHWLFTRRLFDSTLEPSSLLDYRTIAKLWIFADAHLVPLLQNTIADIFAEKMMTSVTAPDSQTIDFIYENSSQGSLLRYTVVQSIRHMTDPDDLCSVATVEHCKEEMDDAESLNYALGTQKLVKASAAVHTSWLYERCCERHVHDGENCMA
ncbi:hypothetical protein LTR36_009689 [Oleoguttula mirabilis]|uniref:BTB domain-containing protein n=1 Tax=Oleoguttula mirabilis TaxID=1507867 RepID=A0AAV9J5D0_9PEZI|nr:hypothetical protein LTR36_009689 [Oleoguttula mirabilis]